MIKFKTKKPGTKTEEEFINTFGCGSKIVLGNEKNFPKK